ncbi:hypothetical protein B0F90DRAFT_188301 [Multifurca ochricompacta]|uniref:Uncharacterized protein n=1 Tax=Multifurca ochricompacta TaxID=376703 RepID=A0AAD4QJY9_9AGAM|nr:hypothetical protein B0F90DRAFT_188301 [Multifurca ochricompacta]
MQCVWCSLACEQLLTCYTWYALPISFLSCSLLLSLPFSQEDGVLEPILMFSLGYGVLFILSVRALLLLGPSTLVTYIRPGAVMFQMLFCETLAMDTTLVCLLCSSDLLGANVFCFVFFHFGRLPGPRLYMAHLV